MKISKKMHNKIFDKNSNDINRLLYIFKLIGLAPFANNVVWSHFLMAYQFLNIILILCLSFSAFFITEAFQENTLSTLVSGLVFIALMIAHSVITIESLITRNVQKKMFDAISEIDEYFQIKLYQTIDRDRIKWKMIFIFSTIWGTLILLLILQSYLKIIVGKAYDFWYSILSIQVLRMRFVQDILYVNMINERILLLNNNLEVIVKENRQNYNSIIFTLNNDMRKEWGCIGKKINDYNDRLLILKQIYGKMYDVITMTNECFGWSILAMTTQYFIDFTSNAYWMFLSFENILPKSVISEGICQLIPIMMLLTILSLSCSACTNNGALTGELLHKIDKTNTPEPYSSLISEFSLQVIHEPLHFTATGFFNINSELLGSMAAATITYLVILIQFQLTEKSKPILKSTNVTTL